MNIGDYHCTAKFSYINENGNYKLQTLFLAEQIPYSLFPGKHPSRLEIYIPKYDLPFISFITDSYLRTKIGQTYGNIRYPQTPGPGKGISEEIHVKYGVTGIACLPYPKESEDIRGVLFKFITPLIKEHIEKEYQSATRNLERVLSELGEEDVS